MDGATQKKTEKKNVFIIQKLRAGEKSPPFPSVLSTPSGASTALAPCVSGAQ